MSKCRICECTDADGCAAEYGCTWVQPDLCSTCADFLEVMAAYMMLAGPHDRHTIEHATAAVRRCLVEIGKANEVEEPDLPPMYREESREPLIVLAKD